MENASKALIIAGAILLVIAIIAIAVGIVSKSRNTTDVMGGQISAMEVQIHNKQFEGYESEGEAFDKTFEEARELARLIMASNSKNENNREFIVYLSLGIKQDDRMPIWNRTSISAQYYIDDKANNYDEQKLKPNSVGDSDNQYTVAIAYNHPRNKDKVININKYNQSSLYNIQLRTDERGLINDIRIAKRGNHTMSYIIE